MWCSPASLGIIQVWMRLPTKMPTAVVLTADPCRIRQTAATPITRSRSVAHSRRLAPVVLRIRSTASRQSAKPTFQSAMSLAATLNSRVGGCRFKSWSDCCGNERDLWRPWRMAARDRNTLTQSWLVQSTSKGDMRAELPPPPSSLRNAVAVSAAMAEVLGQIQLFASAETVVFEGATGTGKSYLARALHEASGRRGAFVDVSAGEFEPGLALDQLFGHVRGAFTGAMSRHRGLFAEAEGGTLLIDEFHLLRRSQQAMLIRALERRVYRPIGYERDVPVTCAVVVGVEEGLDCLVARGRMRANLRSRLGQCVVRVPTLDERRDEIAALAHQFLRQCPAVTHAADGPTGFAPDALGVLELANYSDNLRDLRGVVRSG